MKAFISVDLEGMPYIVIPGHLNLKGSLYKEARSIATKVTLIVAEELNKNGFDEVVIADSHGPMVNLLIDNLPEFVEIIRGYPRPLSMISGVGECDAALFLGYHAKFGTARSTWDHTYSGSVINKVEVNGILTSEFLMNSYVAGDLNVPVILVAGEAQLLEDVKQNTPWVETLALKRSLSRVAARSFSMVRIDKELRSVVQKAVTNFKQNRVAPLIVKKPVQIGVTFSATHYADTAELLHIVNRINGLKVEYTASDMIEAYNVFHLLVFAAFGHAMILEREK